VTGCPKLSDYLEEGEIPSVSQFMSWPCQIHSDFIENSEFIKKMYPFMNEKQLIAITVRISSRLKHQVKKGKLDKERELDDELIKTLCLPPEK
jgi:hypothetical protein